MSAILQRPLHRAQHTGKVGTEGPEQDGEVPPLPHQVPEELEEGGQDPVVQPPIFSFAHQLTVPLPGSGGHYTQSGWNRAESRRGSRSSP